MAAQILSRPWTPNGLRDLKTLMADDDATLFAASVLLNRTREEIDRALWVLVGRTTDEAAKALNAAGLTPAEALAGPSTRRFMREFFPRDQAVGRAL